jgi:DNA topoisomerase-1
LSRRKVIPEQHFTQPPPRYTEASLVKRMEELGIGRPSTYASILSVLQQRDYVRLEKKRFVPEDRGRLVTSFLVSFFKRYVEYDFTARMEDRLDDISGGKANWKEVMGGFWESFAAAVAETKDLTTTEVIDALDEVLGPHFFNDDGSGRNPRDCPNCDTGRLGLKLGKYGAFIGCSTYPECKYTRKLAAGDESPEAALIGANGPVNLGGDAVSGEAVTLRNGPYGFYIQLGEGEDKKKPKRVSLPKEIAPDALTLKTALGLLALPRDVGPHPDTGKMIQAGIGRFGPYLRHNGAYASLGPDEDLLTIGLNRAVDLLQNAKPRGESGKLRVLGEHPEDGKPVSLHGGRYGPYVKHGSINATVPPDRSLDTLTLDEALVLIADRVARGPAKKKTARKTGKKTAKKAGTGKSKARKAAARKRAAKKRIAPRAPTDAG